LSILGAAPVGLELARANLFREALAQLALVAQREQQHIAFGVGIEEVLRPAASACD
jgi:predicted N-formylglutamate amidohydrolase